MFTKYINPNIQQTLRAKENALSRKLTNDNVTSFPENPSAKVYNDITDIANRTVFFRMISNKLESDQNVNNIVISGGERNEDGTMKFGLVKGQYFGWDEQNRRAAVETGAYFDTKLVDEKGEIGHSQSGIRHIAGIKNVEVAYKDKFKAIREANVSWVVGSLEDLERLTPHFLTVGKTIMLDWGWVNPNQGIEQQFEGQTFYQDGKIDPRLFTQSQSKILKAGGNYGAMGGVISNFDYQLRQDGGFDCNTKIVGLGSTLFKKPIDKGMNDRAILGKKSIEAENSDDETEDKIDVSQSQIDSFLLAIVNLREIILENVFRVPRNVLKSKKKNPKQLFAAVEKGDMQTKVLNVDPPPYRFKVDYFLKWLNVELGIFFSKPASIESQIGNVIAFLNDQDIEGNRIYVTWGFFEDQILNRYISYVGEDQELKMTIRSIDTILDEKGNPKLSSDGTGPNGEEVTQNSEGQWMYLENGDGAAVVLSDYNPSINGKTMKKSVSISNHPDLYSKDLGKYILPGQNNLDELDFGGKDKETMRKIMSDGMFNQILGKRVQNFKDDEDETIGYLRNIYISTEEIQRAFGVGKFSERMEATEKGHIMISDLNPPSSVEAGLKKLLKQMSDNFFNIWDFELISDPYDSTNVKIIDKNFSKEQIKYSDVDEENYFLYKFPAFTMSSMVKNQNLAFKIPSAVATTIMYGSNRYLKSSVKDPQHVAPELMAVFATDTEPVYKDNLLHGLEPVFRAEGWESNKIGSEGSSPNSKIGKDIGELKITYPLLTQISQKTGTDGDSITGPVDKYKKPDSTLQYRDSSLHEVTGKYTKKGRTGNYAGTLDKDMPATDVRTYIYSYNSHTKSLTIRDDAIQALSAELKGEDINAENRENIYKQHLLIPAELSLEIDGIAGILPGDIIHTDYIQKKYNKSILIEGHGDLGPFAYFQVVNVNQKISGDGWTTELETVMRVNKEVLNNITEETLKQLKTDTIARGIDPIPAEIDRPIHTIPGADGDIEDDVDVEDLLFEDPDFDILSPVYDFRGMPTAPYPKSDLVAGMKIRHPEDEEVAIEYKRIKVKIPNRPIPLSMPVRPSHTIPGADEDIEDDLDVGDLVFEDPNFDILSPVYDFRGMKVAPKVEMEVDIDKLPPEMDIVKKDPPPDKPEAPPTLEIVVNESDIPPCLDGSGPAGDPLFTAKEYKLAKKYVWALDKNGNPTVWAKPKKKSKEAWMGKGSYEDDRWTEGADIAYEKLRKIKEASLDPPSYADMACASLPPLDEKEKEKVIKQQQTPMEEIPPAGQKEQKDKSDNTISKNQAQNAREISNAGIGEPELISTYGGLYWQNSLVLYKEPHKPEWRPPPEGPKNKSYYGEAEHDNVPFEKRKEYWDANIEAKNETGISTLPQKPAD